MAATTRMRRTAPAVTMPANCPQCGDPMPTDGRQFCLKCGYSPQREAEIADMRKLQEQQTELLEQLRDERSNPRNPWLVTPATLSLVRPDPSWSPRRRGWTATLVSVLLAFFIGIIGFWLMIAIGLSNTVFYTPWWEIPVPTGFGILLFVIVILFNLFNNAKK